MAALLRGFARSFAVVAAKQPAAAVATSSSSPSAVAATLRGAAGFSSATALSTAQKSERAGVMASVSGLCGSRILHPPPGIRSAQQLHPLSSSAALLVHCRLSVHPQERRIAYGIKHASAFQRKSSAGHVVSVEEANDEAPCTSYREQLRESWSPASSSEQGSVLLSTGQVGRNFNGRGGSVSSAKRFRNPARHLSTSVSASVLQESEGYRKSPSLPFHTSREFSSSALLAGFDDSEGSDMDVQTYRRMHEITTTGDKVPDPVMTFASTGFPPTLMKELRNAGFSSPSAIQAMTWPIASQDRDVVAVAKTGSGKTLGYLIPAFLRLGKERVGRSRNPSVLVLAPTRELANQIRDETWKFGRSSRISCTCVCGGVSKGPQLRDIERGVDVIVATPGRLNDLLEMGAVNLQKVSYLVLDEADRMLDMGFEPQIRAIVDQMSLQRQTLMYTATWPHEVRRIARDLLNDPVQVNIGNSDQLSANKDISQTIEIISRYEKEKRLDEILKSLGPESKVLIFCTTKRMCDELAMNIRSKFGALAIHGDKSQRERDYVINQFKKGRTAVLVATDVAARGLDIKDIRMVINYDFPTGVEDYVHRIGRTGRAGATGVAHTFFGYEDAKHARDLIKVLESTAQIVSPDLRQMAGRGDSKRSGFSRYGGRSGGQRSQQGYYTGKSDASSRGSKWGQSNHSGGNSNGNRFGSGNDRFGTGNGRFGSGTDRVGNRSERFGNGSDRFGSGRFSTVNLGQPYEPLDSRSGALGWRQGREIAGSDRERDERKSFEMPLPDRAPSSSQGHQNPKSIDKSLITPRYGELKMNSDGISLW